MVVGALYMRACPIGMVDTEVGVSHQSLVGLVYTDAGFDHGGHGPDNLRLIPGLNGDPVYLFPPLVFIGSGGPAVFPPRIFCAISALSNDLQDMFLGVEVLKDWSEPFTFVEVVSKSDWFDPHQIIFKGSARELDGQIGF